MDEAKEHRYRKVYNKLKDFEDYMKALGVDTVLPQIPVKEPPAPTPAEGKDAALASGNETARDCLLYTSPSPRDRTRSRMPSSA